MGSTESTLPEMEDAQEPEAVEAPEAAVAEVPVNRPIHRRPRRRRHTTSATTDLSRGSMIIGGIDDPWWWEVENENLILDQVPQIAAAVPNSESILERASELSDDFNTLLKIGENVNATLNNNENSVATMATTSESIRNSSEKIDYSANNASVELVKPIVAGNREQTLEEFKEELRIKRLARQTAVQDLRDEITTLRQQLSAEKALTRRLCRGEATADEADYGAPFMHAEGACGLPLPVEIDTDDEDPKSRGRHANIELANAQLALQLANSENISLRTELGVVHKQVGTLKEVIACCKQMIAVKEEQCSQLKSKLGEIETSFAEREMRIMSDSLRQEYERQLGNIRQLRQLYEERQRVSAAEHENLQRLISIKKDELLGEQEKTKSFEECNQALVKEVENANNEIAALRDECSEHKFEKRALKEEMGAVNTLFSQMVMGFNGKNNLDIDRLTTMLEENRTLLNDMATKEANCSDGATLPKLLFELVEQATVGNKLTPSSTPTLAIDGSEEQHATIDDIVADANDNDIEEVAQNEVHVQNEYATESGEGDTSAAAVGEGVHDVATTAAGLDLEIVAENGADLQAALQATTVEEHAVVAKCLGAATRANKSGKKHHRKNASNGNNKAKLTLSSSIATTIALPTSTSTSTSTAVVAAGAIRKQATAARMFKFHEPEIIGKVASAQEIIGNLPKVWKVLIELLSHHKIEQVQFEENGNAEDCYKSVETPNGPRAELSVSKTYIKLKDLILEKKSLVKETNRLKTLNSHLEYRLNEQEKRLSAVSLELTKTWHLVGKMQRQHRQLHTQEQILRYQLQQKRRLLTELKDELEYCRRKWAAARAKNDESQEQWNDLRREFAKRKLDDANNSAESGYSDSGPASDEEERAAAAAQVAATRDAIVPPPPNGNNNSSSSACSRRKHFRELFEHTRKIKRMQSTSPGRAGCEQAVEGVELVLRWNSAPPTCGWRRGICGGDAELVELPPRILGATSARGTTPKARSSRSKQRNAQQQVDGAEKEADDEDEEEATDCESAAADGEKGNERATRIQRLEEQCKSLIQQVLETSDNRERLEVQLCRFQDAIAPVQYAVPLDEYINRKRMIRASSAPATGTLTAREEEYTRKRSERLERLEEESRQLMTRIKHTSDRGQYLRCSLDRIRRVPSREGSCESNTEEEVNKNEERINEAAAVTQAADIAPIEEACQDETPLAVSLNSTEIGALTAEEEAYTSRRAARLQRLEEESKQLLTSLSRNTQRGETLGNRLDTLHERYVSEESNPGSSAAADTEHGSATSIGQRLEDIEKISTNRAERLRLLEEEGKQLLSRLSNTSERGTRMINHIAERELNRQARLSATPSRETDVEAVSSENNTTAAAADSVETPTVVTTDEAPLAAALMPTIKNVACSSIVDEELKECVKVTTTPSHIATQQGAVSKSKPLAQLCAARPKAARRAPSTPTGGSSNNAETESLEEMVKRLQTMPFPADEHSQTGDEEEKEKDQ